MSNDFSKSFSRSLPLPPQLEPHLREALLQVLNSPGSLARPQLLLQVASVYAVPEERAEELAIAIEYFHTASLLIDDLPCMDDATERRSMPCLHVRFGEATTILASLALVNRAYMLAWRSVAATRGETRSEVLSYLEASLGVDGLLNGQSLDLRYRYDALSAADAADATHRIAQGKTVPLIRLALVLPAILGGAPQADLIALERLSNFFGLSYQIIDDLKDVLNVPSGPSLAPAFGKTPGRDQLLGRPNAVLSLGLPSTLERLERLLLLANRPLELLIGRHPEFQFLRAVRSTLRGETAMLQVLAQSALLKETA